MLTQLHYACSPAVMWGELHSQRENKNGMTDAKKQTLFVVPYLADTCQNTKEKQWKRGS